MQQGNEIYRFLCLAIYTFLFIKIGHHVLFLCLGTYYGILMTASTYFDMYNVLGSMIRTLVL